jgi:hypothetical protein
MVKVNDVDDVAEVFQVGKGKKKPRLQTLKLNQPSKLTRQIPVTLKLAIPEHNIGSPTEVSFNTLKAVQNSPQWARLSPYKGKQLFSRTWIEVLKSNSKWFIDGSMLVPETPTPGKSTQRPNFCQTPLIREKPPTYLERHEQKNKVLNEDKAMHRR